MTTYYGLNDVSNSGGFETVRVVLLNGVRPPPGIPVTEVLKYCASHSFRAAENAQGVLALLNISGLITIENNQAMTTCGLDKLSQYEGDYSSLQLDVLKGLMNYLAEIRVVSELFPHGSARYEDGIRIYINENAIPYKYRHIKAALIDCGLLQRPVPYGSLHIVEPYVTLFDDVFVQAIADDFIRTGVSESNLKVILENKDERALEAEEFIVKFERRRLEAHKRKELIRRISDISVSCGYDIQSFETILSPFTDRLIEVKSFKGIKRFYWTANEIQVAKSHKARYYLYLVDADRLDDPTYIPEILQNPYDLLFSADSPYQPTPDVYLFEIKKSEK